LGVDLIFERFNSPPADTDRHSTDDSVREFS